MYVVTPGYVFGTSVYAALHPPHVVVRFNDSDPFLYQCNSQITIYLMVSIRRLYKRRKAGFSYRSKERLPDRRLDR